MLEINNLCVKAKNKEIINNLNLKINKGEIHVIMGPNGSGKSTLANAILNNPNYTKTNGTIYFNKEDITNIKTNEIANKGIFMSFQTPEEINGITNLNFLKTAKLGTNNNPMELYNFSKELDNNIEYLNIPKEMLKRSLNVGFSGGEKKKNEILQLLTLNPSLAILDETDSGLDVDAIKTVSKGINKYHNKNNSVLIITHNTKLLQELNVDYVHILIKGQIIKSGDKSLANYIEKNGFEEYLVK